MNGQRDVLDPRLGSATLGATTQYNETFPRAPPPPRIEPSNASSASYQSPQPYYNYGTPQGQTSQQPARHNGSHSNQSPVETQQASTDDAGSPAEGEGEHGDDLKRPRACEACRSLKVRCDQDPAHPEIPCKRCAKAGRQCIISQPSRKRQKKADGRVAELERKLDALTAALQQQQTGIPQYNTTPHAHPPQPASYPTAAPNIRTASSHPESPANKRRRTDDPTNETPSYDGVDEVNEHRLSRAGSLQSGNSTSPHAVPDPDSIQYQYFSASSPEEFTSRINSIISPAMAATLYSRYTTQLAPNLPAVVFPPTTTADVLLKERPILYVCILSASSHGQLHPDVSRSIAKEAIGAIADCVVRNGAKSLELIQAMQILALWYRPPERADQTNFYQIIHMAAVMALDIGLGKRFNPAKARRGFGGPLANYAPGPHRTISQDSDTLEARRAWLCCYFLCASASMVLRRPNLVRWTNYMKESIEVLESHPDAPQSDKLFCQHIKIAHICEEIGLQFLMDDSTANISINDPKVTYTLNILENQLKAWKEQIPVECRTLGLQFFEHSASLYLHEIALHLNHNVEDFRLPFTEESLKSVNNTSDTLTQNQMAALEACLKGAHGILDTMLSMDLPTIKNLPMLIYFVRCTYATVILIKMHVAVDTPNSELGKMMKPQDLKVEWYIDNLVTLFSHVTKDEEFRPNPKILRILGLLRGWFEKHKETVAAQQRGEQPAEKRLANDPAERTRLHLLSSAAVGKGRVTTQSETPSVTTAQDWTFNTPSVFDYSTKDRPLNSTDATFPVNQQQGQEVYAQPYPLGSTDAQGMLDFSNPELGWGTNFEQAMDLALGGMDGVQGLDGWFLGDNMAPFTFNGEMMPVGNTQWQPGA